LFLYLKQYRLPHPWQVVVIYPTRSVEREETLQFGEIINLNRVRRIYLDELGEEEPTSLGVGVVKLIIEKADTAEEKAKVLVAEARRQLTNAEIQRHLIDLIETIMVYKLPQKSREEISAMFGLSDLKQTRVYQEIQLENIHRMLQFGLSLEDIAQLLDLSLEVVQQATQQSQSPSGE
jgi:predicted transposase/invertase (TIGR01784 family)